ncbi:MAG: peptide-methionine (R)-S-oxide reductase MsrB [Acidimicrobiia bacterium]|nr:peptide-methionine (R)-S-oxide reductase MsrB [Acidimicrobiia bacterium]
MESRRQFLTFAAVAIGLGPAVAWFGCRPGGEDEAGLSGSPERGFPFQKSDAEWRAALSREQYRVLRAHATEPAFTSPLNDEKRHGIFVCAGCGHPLFASETKYDSGTGWPSFWEHLPNAVGTSVDRTLFMIRTEVHCANCGGHLGHVFPDGPKPTGLRYCMNGDALAFVAGMA